MDRPPVKSLAAHQPIRYPRTGTYMLFAPNWKRDTAPLAATEPPPAQAMFARWVADLLARGENDEALRRAELGTSQFPTYATGWYALARAQTACGAYQEATAAAERCLSLEPDFFAAWDILADLWQRLGRDALAKAAQARRDEFMIGGNGRLLDVDPAPTARTRPAIKIQTPAIAPDDLPVEPVATQKLILKRPAETGRAFETPTLAELYRRQGLLDRALDVYRKILERHPNDSGAETMVLKLEAELSSKRKPAETS